MPTSDATDNELLTRARAGDTMALEALLERHQGAVYRFGMKMCRDREDAKDVLQDTLLAMARSVHDFRGASSISTWLYAITRSFCIKRRRRSSSFRSETASLDSNATPEALEVADPTKHPDETIAANEVKEALEHAISALEPAHREVLLLRDVEGLTTAEVAEVLGLSVPAVKSRLHRARLSVREQLAPLLGVPSAPAEAPKSCPDVLALLLPMPRERRQRSKVR